MCGPLRLLVPLAILFAAVGLRPANAQDVALVERQSGVADRYQKLEELLLRLADVEAAENPERSALLRRAAKQSRDKFVLEKLQVASESLRTEEFQKAVDNQKSASDEISSLLTLLLSEDRSKRIREEKERYTKLLKDLKRNLNSQRSTRARTENGAELEDVLEQQEAITRRSEQLDSRLSEANEMNQDGESGSQDSPSQESQSGQQGDPPSDREPAEQDGESAQEDASPESQDSESQDSESQSGDPSPSQSEDPSQNQDSQPGSQSQQPQPGGDPQQSQDEQQSQQQPQPQTPEQAVEEQLRQAIERMQQAERELERAKRSSATEAQRQAEEKLREAIDQLEQILRQLREEEMQRELARLESRLRKMAAMQTKVLDETIALAATPKVQRSRQTDLKAGDLAFEEKKITLEADRAMLLLREEGSSVAFPEVLAQIRGDTSRVADRLGQSKIDVVTQGIQQDILAALEEMIEALQQAQRELEQQQQQQQQGQQPPPGQQEQPLVEKLAELKLIRTMETRIKSTTERYSGLLEAGESTEDDVMPLLQNLAERQNRLYRITRDLVLRRNR